MIGASQEMALLLRFGCTEVALVEVEVAAGLCSAMILFFGF
jgi:hypothetical protein